MEEIEELDGKPYPYIIKPAKVLFRYVILENGIIYRVNSKNKCEIVKK